jgi:ribosome-binding factor A
MAHGRSPDTEAMGGQRAERVGRQLLHEISNIVEIELADPRLVMVTFTDVRMTSDLRHARVFFSSLTDEKGRLAALTVLEHAAGVIRRELGRRLSLRHVPELRFIVDDSVEISRRISDLADDARDSGDRIEPDDDGSEEE